MAFKEFKKRRTLTVILAMLTALFTILFVASCSGGGTSSGGTSAGESTSVPEELLPVEMPNADVDDVADLNVLPDFKVGKTDSDNLGNDERKQLLENGIAKYKAAFEACNFTDLIDPDGDKRLEILYNLDKNENKDESLYGKTGLNGLYGVYQTTYRFYKNYLFVENVSKKPTIIGYVNINPDHLANYYLEDVKRKAEDYIKQKFTVKSDSDCTTECDGSKAVEFAKLFRENELYKIKTANDAELEKVDDTKKAVKLWHDIFFVSSKYQDPDGRTAYEKVYGEDGEVKALNELNERVKAIDAAFMKDAKNDYDADTLTKDVLNEYIDRITGKKEGDKGLRTYISIARDNVNAFGKPKDKGESDDVYIERLKGELVKIEEYLKHFDNLGNLKDSKGKEIDLRFLKGVESEGKATAGEDWTAASEISQKYASLTKNAIEAIKNAHVDEYDVSAEITISNNIGIANKAADELKGRYDKDGKVKADLITGKEIAERFENTYKKEGEVLDGSKRPLGMVASITYTPTSDDGKKSDVISEMLSKIFKRKTLPTITVTAQDEKGNNANIFDARAKLRIREGATPSVERNINKIMNDVVKDGETEKLSDKRIATTKVTEEDREKIKKKSLYLYLTFTILEPASSVANPDEKIEDKDYIVINEKKLENFKGNFLVTLDFGEKTTVGKDTKVKDLVAVVYEHGRITSVNENNNKEEGSNMASFILDKAAMCNGLAFACGDAYKDTAFFIAVGVLGAIVLIFLIWAIVAVVKRKKYKVRYDANGGKFGSSKRVKYCKNLVYPNNPTRKGYQFMGWYTNKKGTRRFDATDKMKRKCVKVYAKWMPVKKYEKVNEAKEKVSKKVKNNTERRNTGVAYGSYGTGVHQPLLGVEVDPRIQKLEVEKLSYEARKAEEERRAEEVRLQTIREIEAAKGNEDAKANAEKDAEKAKLALQQALAEREALISLAKAEERSKVLEEMLAANNGDGLTSEDIEKIKKETEDRIRAEIEEENRRKETESLAARVKALEEANLVVDEERINALLDEKLKAYESDKAYENEITAKLAEAEAKAEAEAEKARVAEEARLQAEAARAKAEEEANKTKEEEAARLARELEIKIAEEEARRKAAEEDARLKEEEEARQKAEEEENRFKPEATFDELKAEMLSYKVADDLGYGLGENSAICSIKVADGAVVVEANLDKEDCLKKGYDVTDGDALAVKMVVNSNDEIENAKDLIEDAAYENGYAKGEKAEVTESDDETRANGYVLSSDKRPAENVDEYYKLLRVYAKSFVLADGEIDKDKPLIKMLKSGDKIYIYLNYAADNLNAAGEEMQAEGYKSIMVVKTYKECEEAIKAITAMMRENGLIRFPTASTLAEDNSDKGFTYTLRA